MFNFQESYEGFELLKTAIAKGGYIGKVSVISSFYLSYTESNLALLGLFYTWC